MVVCIIFPVIPGRMAAQILRGLSIKKIAFRIDSPLLSYLPAQPAEYRQRSSPKGGGSLDAGAAPHGLHLRQPGVHLHTPVLAAAGHQVAQPVVPAVDIPVIPQFTSEGLRSLVLLAAIMAWRFSSSYSVPASGVSTETDRCVSRRRMPTASCSPSRM